MKTTKFYLLFLFSLLICCFSLSSQVVALTNLGEPNGSSSSIGDVTAPAGLTNLIIAQEFVTGSISYTNEPITVAIGIFSTGGSSTFQVDIYSQSGGDPNVSILTLSGPGMPAPGNASYTGMATLAASTSYYIVVSAPLSSVYQINFVSSGNINMDLGFTAPNEIRASSSSGAPSWGAPGIGRIKFSLQIDNAVLPIELIAFKGKLKEETNVLEWVTASEVENDYFEIQHSLDGKNFDIIGTQKGGGTTNTLSNYHFYHQNPTLGVHYYRLKQINFDSRYEYSDIISIKVQEEVDQIMLYPIPAKNQLTIKNGQGNAIISNMLGQTVQEFSIKENNKTIQIDHLQEGQYFLQIIQANGHKIGKTFIKD